MGKNTPDMPYKEKKTLLIDLGDRFDEAKTFQRENPEKTLRDLVRAYSPRFPDDALPDEAAMGAPLETFLFQKVVLRKEAAGPPEKGKKSDLRRELDRLWEMERSGELSCPPSADRPRTPRSGSPSASRPEDDRPLECFPERLEDNDAVRIAYRDKLDAVSDFLKNGLSVLVACDKILTELIYEYAVHRAGKSPVLDDEGADPQRRGPGSQLEQAARGGNAEPLANLPELLHNLKEDQVLVLRSLDMLDNPATVELLYRHTGKGKRPQLLAFLDPSLKAGKVLTDRFSVHVHMTDLPRYATEHATRPRDGETDAAGKSPGAPTPGASPSKSPPEYCVSRLLTRAERACFRHFDPEGLYKNVAGLNAIQFRNAMRYVAARVAPGAESRIVYRVIRQFKTSTSEEIEIPETTFDDIGGYDHVKHQLRRIVALIAGPVEGIDRERQGRLVPRGLIFHGPPGTGKTLFAKAIANEMNATIRMISGPEIMDKYVGESENKLRRIFASARRNAPAVVFFDEFDSIAAQRSNYSDGGARANNAVVAQLLTELDGFRQDQTVLVIGTTNRIDIIDEALLRPSRFRPLEIGLPDAAARRRVAQIQARSFGADTVLKDLCALASKHLKEWRESGRDASERRIPEAFLKDLYAYHPLYEERNRAENRRFGFLRELTGFFSFLEKCRRESPENDATIERVRLRLEEIGRKYGMDPEKTPEPDFDSPDLREELAPMRSDIRELFDAVSEETEKSAPTTPENFLENLMELIAEFTEGFNNDEIRAIFQEASLERHMEGRLITPRFLGEKIGLIRKRRDEREATHLGKRLAVSR